MHAVQDMNVPIQAELAEWNVVITWLGVLCARATNTLPIGHIAKLPAAGLHAA